MNSNFNFHSNITTNANTDNDTAIRVLHLEQGNLLDVDNINIADIIMLETDVPKEYMDELCRLLKDMRGKYIHI